MQKNQFKQQLKNVKNIVFDEAIEFIKEEAVYVTERMTQMHRSVVTQFLNFKRRNEEMLIEREKLLKNWQTAEMALAY